MKRKIIYQIHRLLSSSHRSQRHRKKPINKTNDPSWWAINIFHLSRSPSPRRESFQRGGRLRGWKNLIPQPSLGEYVPTRGIFPFLWHVNALPTTAEISSEGRGIHQTFPTDVSARTPARCLRVSFYILRPSSLYSLFFFSSLSSFLSLVFFHWKENSNNVETGWNNCNPGAGTAPSRDNL